VKILVFAILCLVWGLTWQAIKVSLEGLPPYFSAGVRFTLAFIVLLLYTLWKRVPLRIGRREFQLVTLTALLVYTLDYGLIYWGEQYISAGVAAIFFATFPLFTALFTNFLFRHEHFKADRFIGLAIGFLGIVLVFYDQLARTQFSRAVLLGSLAVIIGAASAALSLVIVKKYLPALSPLTLTFHQLWIGGLTLLGIGMGFEDMSSIHLTPRIISAILYLGVAGSALAFVLWYWLLQKTSTITVSLIIYITPIVALIGDLVFFREIIPLRSFIGMVVVFIGIGYTQKNLGILVRIFRNVKA
jgi:drug/metabolite transporter (DMT)-like permease